MPPFTKGGLPLFVHVMQFDQSELRLENDVRAGLRMRIKVQDVAVRKRSGVLWEN